MKQIYFLSFIELFKCSRIKFIFIINFFLFTSLSFGQYCTPSSTTSTSRYVSNFTTTGGVTNINNSSGTNNSLTSPGYSDFTHISASQNAGGTINFSASFAGGRYGVVIWVDWNNDDTFDASEKVYGSTAKANPQTGNFSTAGQSAGDYRMRVRAVRGQNDTSGMSSCGNIGNSETEDYTLTIIALTPPTISGLGSSSGCTGSTLTINGTDLSGATSVTIGGTAATITANTGTTIEVTIGSGTTGTVTVTTPSGSDTSASTFTVLSEPATPGNPTSNSPQCLPGGVTITQNGSDPSGPTYYWQTSALGTSTSNNANTPLVTTTSGTYYIRSYNGSCWSSGSGSISVIINDTINTTASNPSPANNATDVCYSGPGAINNVSWTAATGATSYDVYFGTTATPPFIGNQTALTYSTGTLASNTTYYWEIIPKNNCGDTTGSPITWSFTTKSSACYCTPDFVNNVEPITYVGFTPSITNVTSNVVDGTPDLEDFTATISTTVLQNGNYTIYVEGNTVGNYTNYFRVFFDWDQNGVFDLSESTYIGTITNSDGTDGQQASVLINVPIAANLGSTTMRVMKAYVGDPTDPCATGTYGWGQAEDYTINVVAPVPCSEPTAQPSNLVLNVSGTTIGGTFTAASPAPDSYLVVYNTTNTTPVPVDGTSYNINDSIGTGNIVADTDGNTSFTATGLSGNTTYYFFVFSYNNSACTPNYFTAGPLTNTATTGVGSYCTPAVVSGWEDYSYITEVSFLGSLNDVTNTSTYSSAPLGYQDFTALANKSQQADSEGFNVYVKMQNTSFLKAWVDWDKNGDFTGSNEIVYDSGGYSVFSTTFGVVIPAGTPPGDYRIRIRHNSNDISFPSDPNSTNVFDSCGTIDYGGETEDYLFEVVPFCDYNLTSITDGEACGPNQNVLLEFEGSTGTTGFEIYANETGGSPLSPSPSFTAGANPTGSWTTPSISTTTTYWVTAVGSCESLVRTKIVATINPIPTLDFTPSTPTLCGEDTIVEITASGDKETIYLIDEDFESGGLGVFSNVISNSNGPTIDAKTAWQNKTSTYVPSEETWFPAISSGFSTNKFAMVTSDVGSGDVENRLESNILNTEDFLNLTLNFDAYFSKYYVDNDALPIEVVKVEASINGGSDWTTIETYNRDLGIGTKFENLTIDLLDYINQDNLVIGITYRSDEWTDGAAIDNIQLYGEKPLSTDFDWVITADAYTDPAATNLYVSGVSAPVSHIYVKATPAQLENNSFTFNAQAILSNGCDAATDITINNNTKYFKGISSNWNDPNNWKPNGVPSPDNCVIIPDSYTGIINGVTDADALNVTVKNGGDLTIESDGTLTIVDYLDIQSTGVFDIESGGSLIQINNVANSGIGNVNRTSANVRDTDYIYWSSPVSNQIVTNVSSSTPNNLIYQWVPTIGSNTNGYGDWIGASGSMTLGKGYILRSGSNNNDNSADTAVNGLFRGVLNNGNISMTIVRGNYDSSDYSGPSSTIVTKNDDNWNLLGNPYPSALDAEAFLVANTNIEGAIHIWTHGTQISESESDPFYSEFALNYNVNDYITYNKIGSNLYTQGFNGKIASGQGFFVLMEHSGTSSTESVNFNNSMRDKSYDNNDFFRSTTDSNQTEEEERHRIWLNLISPTEQVSNILIGYMEGATLEKDRLYDAYGTEDNSLNLYSSINEERMVIQGRPLPFDSEDQVKLGAFIPNDGNYIIAIAGVDGIFFNESQGIFLEDLELNIIHDLRNQPYSFNAESGNISDRFILRYTNNSLSTEEHSAIDNLNISTPNNAYIKITSYKEDIKDVLVYDLLGRKLIDSKNILKPELIINELNYDSGTFVVKVTLANGIQKTQKVILK